MIAGMTGSGKSTWVRSLLQQASEAIYPPPERIVWCYYVKYYVNKRNFIVFDDQMIDASKDKRIVNLFTRGYHYRNLSVIYIVQNLFH